MRTPLLAASLIASLVWCDGLHAQARLGPPIVSNVRVTNGVAGNLSFVEITPARIKFDDGHSNTRVAVVRFLANVDCRQYPDAESGLITALRVDRTETVRLAAVRAIADCSTATPRMYEALCVTALGSDLDGNPAESSQRVRAAANEAVKQRVYFGLGGPVTPVMPPRIDAPASLKAERDLAKQISVQSAANPPTRPFRKFLAKLFLFDETVAPAAHSADVRSRGTSTPPPQPAALFAAPPYNKER